MGNNLKNPTSETDSPEITDQSKKTGGPLKPGKYKDNFGHFAFRYT